jgi:hypothetical protein
MEEVRRGKERESHEMSVGGRGSSWKKEVYSMERIPGEGRGQNEERLTETRGQQRQEVKRDKRSMETRGQQRQEVNRDKRSTYTRGP